MLLFGGEREGGGVGCMFLVKGRKQRLSFKKCPTKKN